MRLSVEPWACTLNQRFLFSWVAESDTISFLTEKRSLMLYICVSEEPNLAGFDFFYVSPFKIIWMAETMMKMGLRISATVAGHTCRCTPTYAG